MDKFSGAYGLVVAQETESRALAFELELVGGLVRIVASYAVAVSNGFMDNGAGV